MGTPFFMSLLSCVGSPEYVLLEHPIVCGISSELLIIDCNIRMNYVDLGGVFNLNFDGLLKIYEFF